MKKPTPKGDSKKNSETSNPWNDKSIGKALDVAKEGASTLGNLVDWGREVQRTKQAEIDAYKQIREAEEKTKQTRIKADADIAGIHRNHFKDRMEHELQSQQLKNQRENDAALIRQRDRLLDKLLNNAGDNTPQLADSLRALLPNADQQ